MLIIRIMYQNREHFQSKHGGTFDLLNFGTQHDLAESYWHTEHNSYSQLISVQRFKHFPEESWGTLDWQPQLHSPIIGTLLWSRNRLIWKEDISHINLFVYVKISLWERVTYDSTSMSGSDFFRISGKLVIYSIAFPCAPHLHSTSN